MGEPPLLGWGFRAQVQHRSPTNMRRSCSSYMESAGQRSGETWPERSRAIGCRPWPTLGLADLGLADLGVIDLGMIDLGMIDLGMISANLVAGAPTRRLLRLGPRTTE